MPIFFDLQSWNFVYYAFVVAIMLIFVFEGKDAFVYRLKWFFYYFHLTVCAFLLNFIFVFTARNLRNFWYMSDVMKHMTHILGIKWELRDMHNVVKDGAIVVANHQTALDVLGMFELWRILGKCTVIAKKELLYFGPFGICAWLCGTVFIDRSKASKAYGVLTEVSKLVQKDKTKIFFYPEGTRNGGANKTKKFLPFKKGAFKMAIACQTPIVPLVFSPYYFINSDDKYFRKGKVVIKALPAIPTTNLTEKDTEDFMNKTFEVMSKAYEELYDEMVVTLPQNHYMRNVNTAHDIMWILSNLLHNCYSPLLIGVFLFLIQYRRSGTLRYYAKFTYFSLHSAFFATVFLPFMFFRPRDWRNALIPAFGLRLIKSLFGFRWRVTGHENIVKDSGSVVLINHQSIIDLIVLAEMWPIMDHCTVISKKEIFYLGPFGLASYLWGTIFIDRLNPDKAKDTINKTGETVKKRKAKLLMFPEGTRHGGDKLLPFKKGAFHVAISSKVPIQPVVVSKYYYIDYKTKRFDSGYTRIDILPPISTEEYTRDNIDDLINKTYEMMSARYKELNEEVMSTVENGKFDLNKNKEHFSSEATSKIEENNHTDLDSGSNLRHRQSQSEKL